MPRGKYKRRARAQSIGRSAADVRRMDDALAKVRDRVAISKAAQAAEQAAYDRGYDAAKAEHRAAYNPSAEAPAAPPFARDRAESTARTINVLNRLAETLNDTAQSLMRSIHLMNGEQ